MYHITYNISYTTAVRTPPFGGTRGTLHAVSGSERVCMYIYIYIHTHTDVCMYRCIYIYIYVHITYCMCTIISTIITITILVLITIILLIMIYAGTLRVPGHPAGEARQAARRPHEAEGGGRSLLPAFRRGCIQTRPAPRNRLPCGLLLY